MKKRIAISQRVINNDNYPERRDALSQNWSRFLAETLPGTVILPVPNNPLSANNFIRELDVDAVILSNGNDWGEAPERDETEKHLFDTCRSGNIPIIGICRGLQAINIMLGGGLRTNYNGSVTTHVANNHQVSIVDDRFIKLSGNKTLTVNSYHKQCVYLQDLARTCNAFAITPDNVVEGFYHKDEPILAIQWHPERDNPGNPFDKRLFNDFLTGGAWW